MRRWLLRVLLLKAGEQERQEILSQAIETIFNTIGKDDILKQENGALLFKGNALNAQQVNALRVEANGILKSKMWAILVYDLKYEGNKKEDEAVTLFQLESAKLLKYLAHIMLKRLNEVASLPQLPEA